MSETLRTEDVIVRALCAIGAYLLVAAASAAPAAAQSAEAAPTELAGPPQAFREPFSSLAGVRELSDGRVIVTDRLEKAVRVLDFTAGSMDEIGRVGSGPGEFQLPGRLLPMPGDSTLLADFGNMRLTVIDPDGRMHRSTSMQQGSGSSGAPIMVMPSGADDRGRLYFDILGSFSVGPDGPPDSAAIARWQLDGDIVDTIAMLPRPEMQSIQAGSQGTFRFAGGTVGPFSPRPGWSAAPDGSVAIVWSEDYRVDWIRADGRRVLGRPTPYQPVPVTDEDKEQWAQAMAGGRVMVMSGSEGGRTINMPRPAPDEMDWPRDKPPFQPRGVQATPAGTVWVQRFVKAGAPEAYDVFSSTGERIGRVTLPDGRTLLGFGTGSVYLYRTDADDLQWLERYPLPPVE
jgi:hypothetical protein